MSDHFMTLWSKGLIAMQITKSDEQNKTVKTSNKLTGGLSSGKSKQGYPNKIFIY